MLQTRSEAARLNGNGEQKHSHPDRESTFTEITRGLGVVARALGSPTLPDGLLPSAIPAALTAIGFKGLVGDMPHPPSGQMLAKGIGGFVIGGFMGLKNHNQYKKSSSSYRRAILLNTITEFLTFACIAWAFNPKEEHNQPLWTTLLALGLFMWLMDVKKQANGEYRRDTMHQFLVPTSAASARESTIDDAPSDSVSQNYARLSQ